MSKDGKEKSIIEAISTKVAALFAEAPEKKEKKLEEEEKKEEYVSAKDTDTGVTISAESWEVGEVVVATTEEGDNITLPAASYVLDNGATITVDEDGIITEVVTAEAEEDMGEKKEEEMKKEEPVFVTEQQLAEAMKPVLAALEKVAVQLSATPKPEEKKEEIDEDKVQAENKLLKQRLAEKRKSIADKSNAAPTVDLPQKKKRGHQSQTNKAVMSQFKDFDFKLEQGARIDLN